MEEQKAQKKKSRENNKELKQIEQMNKDNEEKEASYWRLKIKEWLEKVGSNEESIDHTEKQLRKLFPGKEEF